MTGQVSPKMRAANEIAELMYEITRSWDQRLQHAVAAVEVDTGVALTVRQALALWHLDEPLTMTELAVPLGCDQSNVTGIVDNLERQGLAGRQVDERDRRAKRVVLSADGRRLRARLAEALNVGRPLEALTLADLRTLRHLLAKVRDATRSTST